MKLARNDYYYCSFITVLKICLIQRGNACNNEQDEDTSCDKQSVKSSFCSCSERVSYIDTLLTLDTFSVRNSATCIAKCHHDKHCSLAIIAPESEPSCVLMSDKSGTDSPLPFSLDQSDCTAYTLQRVRCQNCGTLREFSCSCPTGFSGSFCELPFPTECAAHYTWTTVNSLKYDRLKRSDVAIKMRIYSSDRSYLIYNVDESAFDDLYLLISEPMLTVDHQAREYALPATMEFYIFRKNYKLTRIRLFLNGTVASRETDPSNLGLMPLVNLEWNNERVFYDDQTNEGNPRNIIEGLSNGARLLSKVPLQVGFDPDSNSTVFFSKVTHQAKYSTLARDFLSPLQLFDFKKTMQSGMMSEAEYSFGEGVYDTNTTTTTKRWELDACWYLIKAHDKVTAVGQLKEALLAGHDVRILLDGTISSDLIHVTFTPNDAVAELAPHLEPFNAEDPLEVNTNMVRTAISVNQIKAVCSRKLGQPEVSAHDTLSYTGSIKWAVTHEIWQKVMTVDSNGDMLSGRLTETDRLQVQAAQDLRICVEFTPTETSCISTGKIYVVYYGASKGPLLYQTRPFIKPAFTSNGQFEGFHDPLCSSQEFLISSDGSIKRINYIIGNENAGVDENVAFVSMTWFMRRRP